MNTVTTPTHDADHDVEGTAVRVPARSPMQERAIGAPRRQGLVQAFIVLLVGLALGAVVAGGVARMAGQRAEADNRTAVSELTRAVERAAKDRDTRSDSRRRDAQSSAAVPAAPSATTRAAAASAPAAPAPRQVRIANYAFQPAKLTVRRGTQVTWTNSDQDGHTVSSDAFGSPLINKGGRYSRTFDQVGTFTYKCGPHPNMTATVTVTA